MPTVKSLGRRVVAVAAGRQRFQPLFSAMHSAALMGRNFGEGDFVRSGELHALRQVAASAPHDAVVLDVGANLGGWSLAAAEEMPTARVFAFEPAPDVFALLVDAVSGRRIEPVPVAVSREVGVATLHRFVDLTGLSSLEARDLSDRGVGSRDGITVQTITVDEFCAERGIVHVHVLKVDAEGHDLAVLQGAAGLLAEGRIQFVQFEFGGGNIDSHTFLRDFIEVLGSGYRISRVLRDGLAPVAYGEREEVFVTANYLAERLPRT